VRSGYQAIIAYVTRDGEHYRWNCQHIHRHDAAAFACACRETRRRFAPSYPRTDLEAFNVMTRPVLREGAAR
jgi:hypothetical protein